MTLAKFLGVVALFHQYVVLLGLHPMLHARLVALITADSEAQGKAKWTDTSRVLVIYCYSAVSLLMMCFNTGLSLNTTLSDPSMRMAGILLTIHGVAGIVKIAIVFQCIQSIQPARKDSERLNIDHSDPAIEALAKVLTVPQACQLWTLLYLLVCAAISGTPLAVNISRMVGVVPAHAAIPPPSDETDVVASTQALLPPWVIAVVAVICLLAAMDILAVITSIRHLRPSATSLEAGRPDEHVSDKHRLTARAAGTLERHASDSVPQLTAPSDSEAVVSS
ncbi:hypothetical protein BDW22DRAFT_710342 [Trametopsis cervina]|nr:hypothetical protein BDW22DRAFT_710342 [Trametopsis cervina]